MAKCCIVFLAMSFLVYAQEKGNAEGSARKEMTEGEIQYSLGKMLLRQYAIMQHGSVEKKKEFVDGILPTQDDVSQLFGKEPFILKKFKDWVEKLKDKPLNWETFHRDNVKFVKHYVFYNKLKHDPNTPQFHNKISPKIPVVQARSYFTDRRFTTTSLYAYVNGRWIIIDPVRSLTAGELAKLKDRKVAKKKKDAK